MKLGFCLFKYFPFGGLQRDFMDIALQCQADGHEIFVYTLSWQGDMPADFNVRLIRVTALANHIKYQRYHGRVLQLSQQDELDCMIGFNKMPGLDVYFASDPSYRMKQHRWFERLSPRYRHFLAYEQAVCGPDSRTHILTLAMTQQEEYEHAWDIDARRFTLLPPGISRNVLPGPEGPSRREEIRREFGLAPNDYLLLMIGSGFRTKGLDRALLALAALPDSLRQNVHLVVIGQDKPDAFVKMADQLNLSRQVKILPGRADIPDVMRAGDCLIHPAHREVAGKVILESLVNGLPVLVTDVCGYAHHVELANAGRILPSPFDQQQLNSLLRETLESSALREKWHNNGLQYGKTAGLYDMARVAADTIQSHCRQHHAGSTQ